MSGSLGDMGALVGYLQQQIREVDLVIGGMVAAENAAGVRTAETQVQLRFYDGKRSGLMLALSEAAALAKREEAGRL
jgi:hypothetical protein